VAGGGVRRSPRQWFTARPGPRVDRRHGLPIAQQKRIDKIIAVDLVDERLERALAHGIQVIDLREHEDDLPDVVRDLTDDRGPDLVIDAVGMEAHGSPSAASPSVSPRTYPMPLPSL
jgi:hypothetical protein